MKALTFSLLAVALALQVFTVAGANKCGPHHHRSSSLGITGIPPVYTGGATSSAPLPYTILSTAVLASTLTSQAPPYGTASIATQAVSSSNTAMASSSMTAILQTQPNATTSPAMPTYYTPPAQPFTPVQTPATDNGGYSAIQAPPIPSSVVYTGGAQYY